METTKKLDEGKEGRGCEEKKIKKTAGFLMGKEKNDGACLRYNHFYVRTIRV